MSEEVLNLVPLAKEVCRHCMEETFREHSFSGEKAVTARSIFEQRWDEGLAPCIRFGRDIKRRFPDGAVPGWCDYKFEQAVAYAQEFKA